MTEQMHSKKIILGITGSIAAYKSIDLAKGLLLRSFDVQIVLSKTAPDFVSVLTLKSLFPGVVHEHDKALDANGNMLHITLGKSADLVLIAPASANAISKLAAGGADCLLSTLCLATTAKIMLAPAMNKVMWENSLVQGNIAKLKDAQFEILGPASGMQACGDVGFGRMLEPYEILEYISHSFSPKILHGKKIIVTAGPTREKLDPVRFLSNYSSGKMGYAIADAAKNMGADVILITGPTFTQPPCGIETVHVESAHEMLYATEKVVQNADIFISTAAVADYRPEAYSTHKIKKDQEMLNLRLIKNIDIISYIKRMHPHVFCVAFAAETNDIEENGIKKLHKKNVDMIAINDVSDGKVFNQEENELHIVAKTGEAQLIKVNTKLNVARILLEIISTHNDLSFG
jgi:phosphopantothenoylcysteine decarboxylase/phosphopantothenate--cysteine ligase